MLKPEDIASAVYDAIHADRDDFEMELNANIEEYEQDMADPSVLTIKMSNGQVFVVTVTEKA